MRTTLVLPLLSLALACEGPLLAPSASEALAVTADGDTPSSTSDAGPWVTAPPITEAEACRGDRWIAYLPGEDPSCGENIPVQGQGRWVASGLFDDLVEDPVERLPRELRAFCLYAWEPAPGTQNPPVKQALENGLPDEAESLGCDYAQVVTPQGGSQAVDLEWELRRDAFHAEVDRLSSLPPSATLEPVRLALIDSAPRNGNSGEAGGGRLAHGRVLGLLALELGCPDPTDPTSACAIHISNHLALPFVGPDVLDPVGGGSSGRISDVARAVVEAVRDWHRHNAAAASSASLRRQPRLVVNASIGWEPRWGGPFAMSPAELPGPARAAHAAFSFVSCNGGVSIGAAGNQPGGPEAILGPLYPGAWEAKPAPSATACSDLTTSYYAPSSAYPVAPPASSYHPLIHAAGGVRGDDEPLYISRDDGRPRIAAPAAFAIAADDASIALDAGVLDAGLGDAGDSLAGAGPGGPLTGTSVSSLVTSAIAATVWAYRPDLPGSRLMDIVYGSGVPLGLPADFCTGAPCPQIRRVSLCRALTMACANGACPAPSSCAAPAAYSGPAPSVRPETLDALADAATVIASPDPVPDQALAAVPVCGHEAYYVSAPARYDTAICPFFQFDTASRRPWAGPQPGSDPCPICPFKPLPQTSTATLYLSFDDDYADVTLKDPTLYVEGYGDIDLATLEGVSAREPIVVHDIPLTGGPYDQAFFSFTIDDGVNEPYAVGSELVVVQ